MIALHIFQTLFEIAAAAFIVWGIIHEDKLIAFERERRQAKKLRCFIRRVANEIEVKKIIREVNRGKYAKQIYGANRTEPVSILRTGGRR